MYHRADVAYENVAGGHGSQRNADAELEYEPGGHCVHVTEFIKVLEPGEHALQLDAPADLMQ